MPNWCDNTVVIKGSKKDMTALKIAVTNTERNLRFSFDAIKQCPPALRNISAPAKFNADPQKVEFNEKKYGAADWYQWCNKNWGTKWDANDLHVTADTDELFSCSFSTAWAPPIPVYEELAKQFPNTNIFINYDEPGCGFSGWNYYENGEECSKAEYEGSYESMRTFMEPDSDVFEWVK